MSRTSVPTKKDLAAARGCKSKKKAQSTRSSIPRPEDVFTGVRPDEQLVEERTADDQAHNIKVLLNRGLSCEEVAHRIFREARTLYKPDPDDNFRLRYFDNPRYLSLLSRVREIANEQNC